MANGADAHPKEIEFRRRWYEAHRRQAEAEPDYEEFSAWLPEFRARAAEVFPLRDRLAADGDLDRFRSELRTWAQTSGVIGFKGLSGSGFVNTLVKRTDDRAELARLLADGLTAPQDRSAAAAKVGALVEHIERVKAGGHPAPGHVPFLLSFFWGMDKSARWPILWPGTRKFLELMTGQQLPRPPVECYLRFVDWIGELDEDSDRFLVTADWWEMRSPLILDSVLVDRSAFGGSFDSAGRLSNAHALLAVAKHFGDALEQEISDVLGRQISKKIAPRDWVPGHPRGDIWVDWRIKGSLGLRLWINWRGVAIAVCPDHVRKGWFKKAAAVCRNIDVDGFRMMATRGSSHGDDVGFFGRSGGFVYGRWYEPNQLDGLDLRAEVKEVAESARPVFKALIKAASQPEEEPLSDPIDKEIEFRKQWYEAHRDRIESASDYEATSGWLSALRAGAGEVFAIRDALAAHGDLERFMTELYAWAGDNNFRGAQGTGIIRVLIDKANDPTEMARLLVDWFTPPRDRSSARDKMVSLAERIEEAGDYPAPGNAPWLLTYLWTMDPVMRWPIFSAGALRFLEFMIGIQLHLSAGPVPKEKPPIESYPYSNYTRNCGDRYLQFVDVIAELDEDTDRFQLAADWWDNSYPKPVFFDPVLIDRCEFGRDLEIPEQHRRNNATALSRISKHWSYHLQRSLPETLGYELKSLRQSLESAVGYPRSDLRVDLWNGSGQAGYDLRVWVNDRGIGIGISPRSKQSLRKGWYAEAAEAMKPIEVEGYRMYLIGDSPHGEDKGLDGAEGSFFYARWYERGQLNQLDLRKELKEAATALQPAREALTNAAFPPDPIGVAARELLVERAFLDDIVGLLEDKGQVILYGPPGTGKTYLAKRLAEALAPDSEFRALVQFHPSTSYEDFFEGYRPVPAEGGGIGYELTRGPLARMAAHAGEHPGRHVMVIDEINRANLPRVLGELLFLFEYRGERVSTLYRSDGEFHLPESLWFIGTMNTADRSIALVDAALRRRFHFVAFFPGRGPTEGLLGRWLEREKQPKWVDGLVEMVNGELTEAVGEDLQLGFSHFMRKGYGQEPSEGDEVLRRIWRYNIEPFVEDQLFGDPARIGRFRFEEVIARYRSNLEPGGFPEDRADDDQSD